jgi:hypothetical protein
VKAEGYVYFTNEHGGIGFTPVFILPRFTSPVTRTWKSLILPGGFVGFPTRERIHDFLKKLDSVNSPHPAQDVDKQI